MASLERYPDHGTCTRWQSKCLDGETPVEPAEVEEVTVTGAATGSLTSNSPEESAKQKQQVPGGFTIKSAAEMKLGRASNFEDLLQGAPGVFAQSENGMEVTKISVRGSGITAEDEPLGVMFLLDGLSYTYGDGEGILEDFDVSSLSHAEIFRGAAAFKYGALTLGGAINLVPFTGYDSAPFQSRVVGGSFGYFRSDVTGGAVQGPVDEFGSITGRVRDGFRDHSQENAETIFADVGYKFSDQIENRFYLTMNRVDRDLPGGLTKSEMEKAPEQADPLAIVQDWNKQWEHIRLADKLSIRTDEIQFDAGVFWFYLDQTERNFFSPDFRAGIEKVYSNNFGGNLNFVSRYDLFGRKNVLTVGFSPQTEDEHSQNYENDFGHTGPITARGETISINLPVYLEDQFYVTGQFSLIAGAQAIFAERHFRDTFLTGPENQSHLQDYYGFNPKLGAIYEINHDTQAYVNFSRSFQVPSFESLVEFTEGLDSHAAYTPLQAQHAWTIEVGTRGAYSRVQWDCRFITPGSGMNCSSSTIFLGMISVPKTSLARFIRESKPAWEWTCLRTSCFPSKRTGRGTACLWTKATRSTISISMTTRFTAATASLAFRFTSMKRNCFTKGRSVSMPARTWSAIFLATRSITQIRSSPTPMPFWDFVPAFDATKGSQYFWISRI